MLCRLTKPNLPGWVEAPATTTPLGSNSAWKRGVAGAIRHRWPPGPRRGRRRRSACRRRRSAGSGRRTRSWRRPRRPPTARRSTSTSASRSTAGSPRNGPSSAWVARSSIISSASTRSIGTRRIETSAIASARMPPTPTITVMPNCGSRASPAISSRLPRTIGATRTPTSPSSGTRGGEQLVGRATHGGGVAQAEPDEPRSVLWAIASPHSLATTGKPSSSAADAASAAVVDDALVGHGHPVGGEQRLRVRLRQRSGPRHGCGAYGDRGDRPKPRVAGVAERGAAGQASGSSARWNSWRMCSRRAFSSTSPIGSRSRRPSRNGASLNVPRIAS